VHFRAVAPSADGRRHGVAPDGADTPVRLATSAAVIDDMLEVIAR
jgi:hypothetical protein